MVNFISGLGADFWAIITNIFAIIPKLLYLLLTSLLSIIDIFQLFFRKIAGLDTYFVTTGGQTTEATGDIVEEFITGIFTGKYPALANVFWSFVILGVIMLFLATIIAIIRNEYTPEKDGSNSKTKIINNSFKALFTFAIVPVVVLFGCYLGNVILRAFDSITQGSTEFVVGLDKNNLEEWDAGDGQKTYMSVSLFGISVPTSAMPFSGMAFKTSAYKANRVRLTADNEGNDNLLNLLNQNKVTNWGGTFTGQDPEEVANNIDTAFACNVRFKNAETLDYSSLYQALNNININVGVDTPDKHAAMLIPFQTLNKYRVAVVWYYYDLWQFDFFVGYGIAITMLVIFFNIIIGLAKRLFEVVGLFLVSPPVVALMPLDGGSAFGKWKGKFIAKMLGAYGAVIGMNILFLILPIINNIAFFNIAIVDNLIQTLFIIVGLLTVKGFIGLISELSGGEDVNKSGSEIQKDVGSTVGKVGQMVAGAGSAVLKATGVGTAAGVAMDAANKARKAKTAKEALANKQKEQRNKAAATKTKMNEKDGTSPDSATSKGSEFKAADSSKSGGSSSPSGSSSGSGGGTGREEIKELPPPPSEQEEASAGASRSSSGGSGGSSGGSGSSSSGSSSGGSGFGSRLWSGLKTGAKNVFTVGQELGKNIWGNFMDIYKGTEFYKGFKESGGMDAWIIKANGGSGKDISEYQKTKERLDAMKTEARANQFVTSKPVISGGHQVRLYNSDGTPKFNEDGTPAFKTTQEIGGPKASTWVRK